jgi:hypothetical protein
MIQKEFITHEVNDCDAWHCICGNTPVSGGFYSCNKNGNEVEPTPSEWQGLYVCNECGRIIKQDSLEVVGRNLAVKVQFDLSESTRTPA